MESVNYIGSVIKESMSSNDSEKESQKLSLDRTYALLKYHNKPPLICISNYTGGYNDSFKLNWLEKYPWMVYNQVSDGVFVLLVPFFVKKPTQ